MPRRVTDGGGRRRRHVVEAVVVAGTCGALLGLPLPAAAAPPGRAYEMVSPPTKYNGGVVVGQRASDDGEAVGFIMNAAASGDAAAYALSPYVARRSDTGWTTHASAPPLRAEYRGASAVNMVQVDFSDDFSSVILSTNDPVDAADREPVISGDEAAGWDLYSFDLPTRTASWLSRPDASLTAEYGPGGRLQKVPYVGRSHDGRHVFFQSDRRYVTDAVVAEQQLYEAVDGVVRLVGRDRDDLAIPGGSRLAVAPGGTATARGTQAISADGSRVFWQALPGNTLYLRENGVDSIPISVSRRVGFEGTLAAATFLGASRDGAIVYFHSVTRLTDDAVATGIYQYNVETDELRYIVARSNSNLPTLASDDGQRLYFATTARLTPEAVAGARNLYLWDGTLRFIASTSSAAPALDPRLRITPDGRFAVFTSQTSLQPPYGATANAIYRYDAVTSETVCVSCRADGEIGTGEARLRADEDKYTLSGAFLTEPRNLATDGSVYFESDEPLDLDDTNGASDVYEYSDDAGVTLITTGKGNNGSLLIDSSDDGDTVFFVTPESLSGWDVDGGYPDVYAARKGGGFPEPPLPDPICQGDTCQGPMGLPPVFGAPGSGQVQPDESEDDIVEEISFRPIRPTAKQLASFAASGRVVVRVRNNSAGSIMAVARRAAGRRQIAAGTGWVRVARGGTARVVIPLDRATVNRLAARQQVRLTVTVEHSASDEARRLVMRLRRRAARNARGPR